MAYHGGWLDALSGYHVDIGYEAKRELVTEPSGLFLEHGKRGCIAAGNVRNEDSLVHDFKIRKVTGSRTRDYWSLVAGDESLNPARGRQQ